MFTPKGDSAYWLVYSYKHNAWWRANFSGYTDDIVQAGRYTHAQALLCCNQRGTQPDGSPGEVAVVAPEAADQWMKHVSSATGVERERLAQALYRYTAQIYADYELPTPPYAHDEQGYYAGAVDAVLEELRLLKTNDVGAYQRVMQRIREG